MAKISVMNTDITVLNYNSHDYISLTDMASAKEGDSRAADIIKNWIRNRYTIEFLGTWEMIHNPDFKVVEFDHFRKQAGLPSFVLSASEWIESTDAIKQNLIPQEITPAQASRIYANEADVLNMALFGMTALEWRDKHPDLKGNIRDYASINELICLSNMESLNAVFIQDGIPQRERLIRLNRIAIQQMQVLEDLTGERELLK
ncbi:MAG TPA: KilA-N domain-containing protein [Candidatus Bacteroides merdipullorum]|uniref:KilA-N domain-containing protein n=1 Tax=Candidatus Bacteroides merdipullorum TaxID=2838474 RepID=A0A9D2CXT0_9BACE|nr:KilA-N domain-containing protein [Candidatus Bacteroides merdipullorum]